MTTYDVAFKLVDKILSTSDEYLNQSQHDSYDLTVTQHIPQMLATFRKWTFDWAGKRHMVILRNPRVEKPLVEEPDNTVHAMTIEDARLRELTYAGKYHVDLTYCVYSPTNPLDQDEEERERLARAAQTQKNANAPRAKRIRGDMTEVVAAHERLFTKRQKRQAEWASMSEEQKREYEERKANRPVWHRQKLEQIHQEIVAMNILTEKDRTEYPYLIKAETRPKHTILALPVLINSILCHSRDQIHTSRECIYNPGCHFVIHGKERVLMSRVRMAFNYAFAFEKKLKDQIKRWVETRSQHRSKHRSTSNLILYEGRASKYKPACLYFMLPYIRTPIPWLALFRALGWEDDREILDAVRMTMYTYWSKFKTDAAQDSEKHEVPIERLMKKLDLSIQHTTHEFPTARSAQLMIGGKAAASNNPEDNPHHQYHYQHRTEAGDLKLAQSSLSNEVCPHIGYDDSVNFQKGMFLAMMTTKLLLFEEGLISSDDRDDSANKCIQLYGELIGSYVFHEAWNFFKRARQEFVSCLKKNIPINIKNIYDDKTFTKPVTTAFATGNWTARKPGRGQRNKNQTQRTGTSQIRTINNIHSILSQATRICGSTVANGHQAHARGIHNEWGPLDYVQTPEGKGCGVIKQTSIFQRISNGTDDACLIKWLLKQPEVEEMNPAIMRKWLNHYLRHYAALNAEPVLDASTTPNRKRARDQVDTETSPPEPATSPTRISKRKRGAAAASSVEETPIQPTPEPRSRKSKRKVSVEEQVQAEEPPTRKQKQKQLVADALLMPEDTKVTALTVNGRWLGMVTNAERLLVRLKTFRRKGLVDVFSSVVLREGVGVNELYIQTDAGRLPRPLLVVEKLKELLSIEWWTRSWPSLVRDGFIEYLDKEEEESANIALDSEDLLRRTQQERMHFTHAEITPVLALGVCSSQIPFSESNQSARNTFQCLPATEPIRMADGSVKALKEIEVGDEVMTFHPQTMELEPSLVVARLCGPTEKEMVQITTVTGHRLCATFDHLFMTSDGWVRAKDLQVGTPVAIFDQNLVFTTDILQFTGQGTATFIPVKSVVPTERVEIADITTASDNHSFITQSGFGVHNSNMSQQSIGAAFLNFMARMDTIMHVLFYPEKPLCYTMTMQWLNCEELATGVNIDVLFGCYIGYNQEDSVILNKAALERGLFRAMVYKCVTGEEKQHGSMHSIERFNRPDPARTLGRRAGRYDYIEDDGLIQKDVRVRMNDILMSRALPCIKMSASAEVRLNGQVAPGRERDNSIEASIKDEGIVDRVMLTNDQNDLRHSKIRLRNVETTQVGDKFSSRHGQKGTASVIDKECNFPFTASGIIPSLIVNPHAIITRMTIGQLLEMLIGKYVSTIGTRANCTPMTPAFKDCLKWVDNVRQEKENSSRLKKRKRSDNDDLDEENEEVEDHVDMETDLSALPPPDRIQLISRALHQVGWQRYGNERMYNGFNGKLIGGDSRTGNGQMFTGCCNYQRLSHLAQDKIHARATGPRNAITRQAVEGRAKSGGIRLGEMEVACGIGNGAAAFLLERLYFSADRSLYHVCAKCGYPGVANYKEDWYVCRFCNNDQSVRQVRMPYAFNLFLKEMMSVGITARLQTSDPFAQSTEPLTANTR